MFVRRSQPGQAAAYAEAGVLARPPRGVWSDAFRRLRANRLAMLGLIVITLAGFVAIFADLFAPHDPAFQDYSVVFSPPSAAYPLGTDNLGRDALSRLIFGARTSLTVGILAQVIMLSIGLPLGAIAAFFGRRVDNFVMRFVDVIYAFPDLLLVILLRTIFGGSIYMIFVAIGLVEWTTLARVTRGQLLSLKEQPFVTAAQAIGARWYEVLLRHLLPNALSPIIVIVVFGVPRAIFTEAALSFIGIGVQPPTPSWGTMIQDGYQAIFAFPHLILFPALAVGLITLSFTFFGDGLRDALDPRL